MTDNDDPILPREGIAKVYDLVDSLLMGPQLPVTGKILLRQLHQA